MCENVVSNGNKRSALAEWLVAECEARGLVFSKASRLAGVSHDVIGKIVRGSYPPGLDVLSKLAAAFDKPLTEVMQLAGLTEAPARKPVLKELVRDVEALPPTQKAAVLRLWRDALVGAYTLLTVTELEIESRGEPGPGVEEPPVDIVWFADDDEEEAEE